MSFGIHLHGDAKAVLHHINHENAHDNDQKAHALNLIRDELKTLHPDQYVKVEVSGHHYELADGHTVHSGRFHRELNIKISTSVHSEPVKNADVPVEPLTEPESEWKNGVVPAPGMLALTLAESL